MFLVLVAQYESWKLPLAIVLIVPMCLLASVTGLLVRGMPIDILAQIGFVVLVGLAAKNAILIVEFARQKQDEGVASGEAAVHAARTRLRPILMTSFSFILGVAPLVVATGAGAEMRQSLGTAVLWHAGRDRLWSAFHAGLLHLHPQRWAQSAFMTNLSRHPLAHSLACGAARHAHRPVAGSGEGPKHLLGVRGVTCQRLIIMHDVRRQSISDLGLAI